MSIWSIVLSLPIYSMLGVASPLIPEPPKPEVEFVSIISESMQEAKYIRENMTQVYYEDEEYYINTKSLNSLRVKATAYGAHELNIGYTGGMQGEYPYSDLNCLGGKLVEGKTIAVDPRIIPLRSIVYVEADTYPQINGIKYAEDVGGAIKGNKIDVYFDDVNKDPIQTHKVIMNFGIRNATVYILDVDKDLIQID